MVAEEEKGSEAKRSSTDSSHQAWRPLREGSRWKKVESESPGLACISASKAAAPMRTRISGMEMGSEMPWAMRDSMEEGHICSQQEM